MQARRDTKASKGKENAVSSSEIRKESAAQRGRRRKSRSLEERERWASSLSGCRTEDRQ